jgi:hypothetical protein
MTFKLISIIAVMAMAVIAVQSDPLLDWMRRRRQFRERRREALRVR